MTEHFFHYYMYFFNCFITLLFITLIPIQGFAQLAKDYYWPEKRYNIAYFDIIDSKTGKPSSMHRTIMYSKSSEGYEIEDSNFFREQLASSTTKAITFKNNQVKITSLVTSRRLGEDQTQTFAPAQTLFVIPEPGKTVTWTNTIDDGQSVKYSATWTVVTIRGEQRQAIKVTNKSPYYQSYTINYYVKGIGLWKQESQAGDKTQISSKLSSLSFDKSLEESTVEVEAIPQEVVIPQKAVKDDVYTVVEQPARFPGGEAEMYKFIKGNMKYPAAAQRANVQGKVFLNFIVRSTGEIEDIQIRKGLGFGCDEEALRIVRSMPQWNAGKISGRSVSSRCDLSITFTLD